MPVHLHALEVDTAHGVAACGIDYCAYVVDKGVIYVACADFFMIILYCLLLVNVVMLKVNLGLCSQIS